MTRLAGKKHPAPAKYAPRLPLFASLRRKKRGLLCSLLTLCGARCGEKAAALFLIKSKSKSQKERGETAAAPNFKKPPQPAPPPRFK